MWSWQVEQIQITTRLWPQRKNDGLSISVTQSRLANFLRVSPNFRQIFFWQNVFLANSQTLFVLCTEILKHWLPTSPRKFLVLANAYFLIFNQSNLTHQIWFRLKFVRHSRRELWKFYFILGKVIFATFHYINSICSLEGNFQFSSFFLSACILQFVFWAVGKGRWEKWRRRADTLIWKRERSQ